MPAPFGYSLWLWGAAILAILGIIRGKEELDEARGRNQARKEAQRASLEKDQAIRENSDEAVEAADTIRANTKRVSSARMPDEDLSSYHYRD